MSHEESTKRCRAVTDRTPVLVSDAAFPIARFPLQAWEAGAREEFAGGAAERDPGSPVQGSGTVRGQTEERTGLFEQLTGERGTRMSFNTALSHWLHPLVSHNHRLHPPDQISMRAPTEFRRKACKN